MKLIFKILINALALGIVAVILPGFMIASWWTAIVAAVVIGLVNALLKPILIVVTLPITILTFGIFAIILNVLLLMLAAAIVPGFEIDGFWVAVSASILLSLVSWFLNSLTK